MAEFPQSREEAILQATINGEEYTGYPESRIEALLLELKAVIESGGGGGGGTTNYNLLENKPQIGGVTLTGDKSASDLSLASTSRLADAENMVCAEFFDASKAYTKDTYVIYNDGLYKFKSAHTAGAAWDATIVDEVDLLTVIQEATNPTIAPPVLNKESVVSENDVNTLSAILTAQQTSAYMLILSICNSESFPTLTSCTVSVNLEAKTVSDYYVSEGYGIASKYVLLNLEAGDSIAASISSNVDVFGTSASIMLVRLSNSINGLTLKDAEFSNNYVDPTLNFNVEKDAVYLLWFFNRSDGVGTFKTLKKNNANITTNKIVCSSGSGWQISHGMCMVYAKALDTFAVAIQFNGYFDAVGVFEVLMDTGESYNDLKDKPQINGVTLSGNKSLSDLGIPTALASLTDDATHRTVTDAEKSTWNTTGEAIETEKTVSGNPITITDALPYPAVSLSAEIEAIQDLHGFDHPWVGGAGKNKLPMTVSGIKALNTTGTWSGNVYTVNGGTFTIQTDNDGNVTGAVANGTFTERAFLLFVNSNDMTTDFVKTILGKTIILNGCPTRAGNPYAQMFNTWGTTSPIYDNGSDPATLAVPSTISGYRCQIEIYAGTVSNVLFKPMIRLSTESDASFAPYSNICPISGHTSITITDVDAESQTATVTVQLGQTVYGGTLNVTTGVMTMDKAIIDMGDLTYSYNATDKIFYATLGGVGDRLNAISTVFVVASTTTGALLEDGEFMFRTDLDRVYLKCLAYDDATQFKTAMTGQKICYELATPTTIQLTPEQLTMLKGYNRLNSDGGGDITLTYLANRLDDKADKLYGTMVFSSSAMDVGCQDQQLALFRNVSIEQVVGRIDVWTKAVASSVVACHRSGIGSADGLGASRASCALPLANVK